MEAPNYRFRSKNLEITDSKAKAPIRALLTVSLSFYTLICLSFFPSVYLALCLSLLLSFCLSSLPQQWSRATGTADHMQSWDDFLCMCKEASRWESLKRGITLHLSMIFEKVNLLNFFFLELKQKGINNF